MSVGIPGRVLAEIVDGLMGTAERYETDRRKHRMRSACRCGTATSDRVATELAALAAGTGYFVRE